MSPAMHGGQLTAAANKYNIPVSDWLDLSTGINPNGWPVPPLPPQCWQRLPEDDDDNLITAAQHYYQCEQLICIPGSQAGIQILPKLRPPCRVLVRANSYSEHARQWYAAGHDVNAVDKDLFAEQVENYNVVIIVNPDNPSGELIPTDTLLAWRLSLAERGGWLIVDEAFIDAHPDNSLCHHSPLSGLLILRSLGKFFGLAGIRAGALMAEQNILQRVHDYLGPWSISHPTRWLSTQALNDNYWQTTTRNNLQQHSQQLKACLSPLSDNYLGGTELFQTVLITNASAVHDQFARLGIFTRLLDNQSGLRFGLPGTEQALHRLEAAISHILAETSA